MTEKLCTRSDTLLRVRSHWKTYGSINCVMLKPPKLYAGFKMSGTGRETNVNKRDECTRRPITNHATGL